MTAKILWVDDMRDPPQDLIVDIARTYNEAVGLMQMHDYDEVYLDHDLGDWMNTEGEKTGYSFVCWMVQRKQDGLHVPTKYHYLTANPIGRDRMKGTVERYLLEPPHAI